MSTSAENTAWLETIAVSERLAPATASRRSGQWLRWSVRLWWAISLIGQGIFAWYIFAAYWQPVTQGDSDQWNNLFTEFNFAFMAHVGLASAIFVCGPLQLIPSIRARYPALHRLNGRIYLVSVAVASGAGTYLIWFKGTVGGLGVQIGTSISVLLMALFGWRAVRSAIRRDFTSHRRYALRFFMTAISVWFYRIQLMVWLMLGNGRGLDPDTFEGPALVITSFTQYLLPLLVLEFYFYVSEHGGTVAKGAFSVMLTLLTLLMALGIYAASIGLWLPRIGIA